MNEPGSVELKLIHMEDVVSKEVEWVVMVSIYTLWENNHN